MDFYDVEKAVKEFRKRTDNKKVNIKKFNNITTNLSNEYNVSAKLLRAVLEEDSVTNFTKNKKAKKYGR